MEKSLKRDDLMRFKILVIKSYSAIDNDDNKQSTFCEQPEFTPKKKEDSLNGKGRVSGI